MRQDFLSTRLSALPGTDEKADVERSSDVLTVQHRRLRESWRRHGSMLIEFWGEECSVIPSSWEQRALPVRRNTKRALDDLFVDRIDGLPAITSEGAAQDVLGLLKKPLHEQVAYLRWRSQSARRFNQTTAYIYIAKECALHPAIWEKWKMRAVDPINLCALRFHSLPVDPKQYNLVAEDMLGKSVVSQEHLSRWQEVREFLLCVERGDYDDIFVPALSSLYVFSFARNEFLDLSQSVDYRELLTRLASLSVSEKVKNDSQMMALSPLRFNSA